MTPKKSAPKSPKSDPATTPIAGDEGMERLVVIRITPEGKFDIKPVGMDVMSVPTVLELANSHFRKALGLPTIN